MAVCVECLNSKILLVGPLLVWMPFSWGFLKLNLMKGWYGNQRKLIFGKCSKSLMKQFLPSCIFWPHSGFMLEWSRGWLMWAHQNESSCQLDLFWKRILSLSSMAYYGCSLSMEVVGICWRSLIGTQNDHFSFPQIWKVMELIVS